MTMKQMNYLLIISRYDMCLYSREIKIKINRPNLFWLLFPLHFWVIQERLLIKPEPCIPPIVSLKCCALSINPIPRYACKST